MRSLVSIGYALVDLRGGELALLDELGEAALVFGGEQVDLADLTQVEPHGVGRAAVALRGPFLAAAGVGGG